MRISFASIAFLSAKADTRRGHVAGWLVKSLLPLLLALPLAAQAEKADRDKPVNLEADHATSDEAQHITTFTGTVILTQGTLTIRCDKLVVTEDAAGFQTGNCYGNPATFRQKRDNVDEWVDGKAQRIVYDSKSDKVELFDKGELRRNQDQVQGDYISFDNRTEFFEVHGAKDSNNRVKAVIMPKKKADKTQAEATPTPKAERIQKSIATPNKPAAKDESAGN